MSLALTYPCSLSMGWSSATIARTLRSVQSAYPCVVRGGDVGVEVQGLQGRRAVVGRQDRRVAQQRQEAEERQAGGRGGCDVVRTWWEQGPVWSIEAWRTGWRLMAPLSRLPVTFCLTCRCSRAQLCRRDLCVARTRKVGWSRLAAWPRVPPTRDSGSPSVTHAVTEGQWWSKPTVPLSPTTVLHLFNVIGGASPLLAASAAGQAPLAAQA